MFDYITEAKVVNLPEVTKMIYNILEVIQYLQISSIVHRDLKPENILIVKNENDGMNTVKIIDFGLSKILIPGQKMHDQCGTIAYVAPEVLRKAGYSAEVDIWSVGIIAHALTTRKLPYDDWNDDMKVLYQNVKDYKLQLEFLDELKKQEPHLADLINRMLDDNPTTRISVKDALEHAAFTTKRIAPTTNAFLSVPNKHSKKR